MISKRSERKEFLVLFAGDSLANPRVWSTSDPDSHPETSVGLMCTYPFLVQQELKEKIAIDVVINSYANRGSGSAMAVVRGKDFFHLYFHVGNKADLTVFQFGISECWLREDGKPRVSIDEFRRNVKKIMLEKQTHDPDRPTLFFTIMPTSKKYAEREPSQNTVIAAWNNVIRENLIKNCYLVDVEDFCEKNQTYSEMIVHPDGHHLTKEGDKVFAKLIMDTICHISGEPPQISSKSGGFSNDGKTVSSTKMTKLVLGGAQFGLDYGINNTAGQPNLNDVKKIVTQAISNGVEYIDTARAYGNSELILGKVLGSTLNSRAKIITKLSPLDFCERKERKEVVEAFVRESVFKSCVQLNTNSLSCLMLHRASHLTAWNGTVWQILEDLHNEGYIQQLGVSVQTPEELTLSLDYKNVKFIQMPFNIFDHRWSECIEKIKEVKSDRSLTVHTRSSLLQGVCVSNSKTLWNQANLINPSIVIEWLNASVQKYTRNSIIDLCFGYVRAQSWIDGIVVGMETEEQLFQNLKLFVRPELTDSEIMDINNSRPMLSEETLNPACWSI